MGQSNCLLSMRLNKTTRGEISEALPNHSHCVRWENCQRE
jgi:hypothetical protein